MNKMTNPAYKIYLILWEEKLYYIYKKKDYWEPTAGLRCLNNKVLFKNYRIKKIWFLLFTI